jgi:16S rRNA (cytosine967-C5)-methyltransferase
MRSHSYLNTARTIINAYDGAIPLASWLRQFFRSDKKFGSSDRRQIAHACYCFYRLGKALQGLAQEEKMLTALFLCSAAPNRILSELKPEWNEAISLPIEKKLEMLSATEELPMLFPFTEEVSPQVDQQQFNTSFLIQPDLYLRVRPGFQEKVAQKLSEAGAVYGQPQPNCIELDNQTKIDEIISLDSEAVVQDYNSQRIQELFEETGLAPDAGVPVWDCCAASGGKSILFHDHFPRARLFVSDIRESILINLKNRFKKAGIKNYKAFVADVSQPGFSAGQKFDLVLCDAPCSGSGTWSRTPEQLHFFPTEKISYYAGLQKQIVANAGKALRTNGFFIYITCSVFLKENEDVVAFIQNNLPLQLRSARYFTGYDKKADTLFAAVFSAL